ncbi:hypothetical protein [Mesomycoplasma conjunctivae]|uniref:hypothetical protein n=1 Tax=Mesomycoplasma conjunctivae TaxID=45361 RepID=UPI003DA47B9D
MIKNKKVKLALPLTLVLPITLISCEQSYRSAYNEDQNDGILNTTLNQSTTSFVSSFLKQNSNDFFFLTSYFFDTNLDNTVQELRFQSSFKFVPKTLKKYQNKFNFTLKGKLKIVFANPNYTIFKITNTTEVNQRKLPSEKNSILNSIQSEVDTPILQGNLLSSFTPSHERTINNQVAYSKDNLLDYRPDSIVNKNKTSISFITNSATKNSWYVGSPLIYNGKYIGIFASVKPYTLLNQTFTNYLSTFYLFNNKDIQEIKSIVENKK